MAERGSENIKRKPVKPGTIELEAVSIATIVNDEKNKFVSNNNETIPSMDPMSLDLQEGMVIEAKDGGNPSKEEKDR